MPEVDWPLAQTIIALTLIVGGKDTTSETARTSRSDHAGMLYITRRKLDLSSAANNNAEWSTFQAASSAASSYAEWSTFQAASSIQYAEMFNNRSC